MREAWLRVLPQGGSRCTNVARVGAGDRTGDRDRLRIVILGVALGCGRGEGEAKWRGVGAGMVPVLGVVGLP